MRKLLAGVFLALSLGSGLSSSPVSASSQTQASRYGASAQEQKFIDKVYSPSVVLMYVVDPDGNPHFDCTATALARDNSGTYFQSAAHCIDDLPPNTPVMISSEPDSKLWPAEVIAYGLESDRNDFLVVRVTDPQAQGLPLMPYGHNPQHKGERVFGISATHGIGKAYTEGYISLTDIPTPQPVDIGVDWQHNVLFEMPGVGPGASGSTIVCADQRKVCAILIGTVPGGFVAEPVERFEQWWKDVAAKKIPAKPELPPANSSEE